MQKNKNILFIMYDQLRFDYLSCAGHPHLHTPHIDALATRGVRFSNCYVQSPVCGSSRMSFYTGRYVSSHGAAWNGFPLRVGEMTLGEHLRQLDMDAYLVGKTHMRADKEGMERLGISADSIIGARLSECGFDVVIRDDGLCAEGPDGFYDATPSSYNAYLHSKGYDGNNPWHDYANSGVEADGSIASGWMMKNASKPANIREEDSETAYMTTRAIEFIDAKKNDARPWLCHLSYIKPHWPYIVPSPYHGLYGKEHILPVNRHESERENPHPVYEQFMNNVIGQAFRRDEVREAMIPAYMGLIKQADDHLGRLFAHLEETGQIDNTMIVITSDHGDYLGDHWLGEKDLFHNASVKVPLIVFDPCAEAESTRGTVCDELVESIDLAATFVDYAGGQIADERCHLLEGKSLLPLLYGDATGDTTNAPFREYAISEYDYSITPAAINRGIAPRDARLFMVANKRWKLMHDEGGSRPMLFDMLNDPNELDDLAKKPTPEVNAVIDQLYQHLASWGRRLSQRTTRSEKQIYAMRGVSRRKGIVLGLYDGSEAPAEITEKFRGTAKQNYVEKQ